MDYIADANELARRIRQFAFGGSAPAEIEERLQSIPGSQADLLTEAAELLYAHRDLLDDKGLELMGQLYYYAHQQGWSTFNQGDRTDRILALVRRDLKEKGAGVANKDDEWPEPQTIRRTDGVDWRQPEPEPATEK